jgi:hypothetical protein
MSRFNNKAILKGGPYMPKPVEPVSGPSVIDLRGRQSVRATFRLSQKAIDAIGLVAVHMGIKQKSLFDHIIDNLETMEKLARSIRIRQFEKLTRRQKTFVMSRRTIDALSAVSQAYDMPRDALVEYAVQKLESVIQSEKMRHAERKKLSVEVMAHFDKGEQLYRSVAKTLGKDDPFCRHLAKAIQTARKTADDLQVFLNKSQILEDF